jgi:hypothetical protein
VDARITGAPARTVVQTYLAGEAVESSAVIQFENGTNSFVAKRLGMPSDGLLHLRRPLRANNGEWRTWVSSMATNPMHTVGLDVRNGPGGEVTQHFTFEQCSATGVRLLPLYTRLADGTYGLTVYEEIEIKPHRWINVP